MTLKSFKSHLDSLKIAAGVSFGVKLLESLAKEFGNESAVLVFAVVIGLMASVGVYLIERVPKK